MCTGLDIMGCIYSRFMISIDYHKNDLEKKNNKPIYEKKIYNQNRGLNKPIKEVSNIYDLTFL